MDVERFYGALTGRFHNSLPPARSNTVQCMVVTAKAAAISHNMAFLH